MGLGTDGTEDSHLSPIVTRSVPALLNRRGAGLAAYPPFDHSRTGARTGTPPQTHTNNGVLKYLSAQDGNNATKV